MRLKNVPTATTLGLMRAYKIVLSPYLPRACRFEPTCSEYAMGALKRHGWLKGMALALKRLLRCHPLGGSGFDPVP